MKRQAVMIAEGNNSHETVMGQFENRVVGSFENRAALTSP